MIRCVLTVCDFAQTSTVVNSTLVTFACFWVIALSIACIALLDAVLVVLWPSPCVRDVEVLLALLVPLDLVGLEQVLERDRVHGRSQLVQEDRWVRTDDLKMVGSEGCETCSSQVM